MRDEYEHQKLLEQEKFDVRLSAMSEEAEERKKLLQEEGNQRIADLEAELEEMVQSFKQSFAREEGSRVCI